MKRTALLACGIVLAALPGSGSSQASGARYRDPVFRVRVTRDLVYGSSRTNMGVRERLRLDLFEPSGDRVRARSAVVWVHGGGFVGGWKRYGHAWARQFAARGYVAVSIDYRIRPPGSPGSLGVRDMILASLTEYPGQIHDAQHDAQAAVRWLRRHAARYRIDPSRIAIGGGSAGAMTALEVAFNPEDPGRSGNPGFASDVGAVISIAGGSDVRRMERAASLARCRPSDQRRPGTGASGHRLPVPALHPGRVLTPTSLSSSVSLDIGGGWPVGCLAMRDQILRLRPDSGVGSSRAHSR